MLNMSTASKTHTDGGKQVAEYTMKVHFRYPKTDPDTGELKWRFWYRSDYNLQQIRIEGYEFTDELKALIFRLKMNYQLFGKVQIFANNNEPGKQLQLEGLCTDDSLVIFRHTDEKIIYWLKHYQLPVKKHIVTGDKP